MSIQQLDQATNRFGTTKVGDFLNSHTSPDGKELIDDPDIPTGTIEITENGTGINVYDYATADVNVPQPTGKTTITENGENIDVAQYATADVNVAGITPTGTIRIYDNDTYDVTEYAEAVVAIEDYSLAYRELIERTVTSVYIPNGVTTIGANAFEGCDDLTSVYIPNGVTTIGVNAFFQTHIPSISLPNGLITIGDTAFQMCARLATLYIPNSVTSIGEYCFADCPSLTDIYYTGTQAEWEAITGISDAGIPEGATIHYEYTPE